MAIKFVFTAVAQAGQDLQLQEVELFGPDGQLNVTSASNPYGESVNGQDASKAIDGNKVDKWSKFLDEAVKEDLKLIVEFIDNVAWSFNPDEFDTDPSTLMNLKGSIKMSTRQLVRDFAFSP